MNNRFFVASDGAMHRDLRPANVAPFRSTYRKFHQRITSGREFRETWRAIHHAVIDGVTWYWLTDDAQSICQDCARENFRLMLAAARDQLGDGWQPIAACIEYAETTNYCSNCNSDIAECGA